MLREREGPPLTIGVDRRRRWLLAVVGAAAVLAVGGLVGASFVKSPEQQRSAANGPGHRVLTAHVEQRVLTSTIVTSGEVAAARQTDFTPTAGQGATTAIVTAVHTSVGNPVENGHVVLAVSGRPLIILHGAVPAYRDLRPGTDGDDIAELQNALQELGDYHGGDAKGHFGEATKSAVRRLYSGVGFTVADTGGPGGAGDRPALRAAQDAVTAAQATLDTLTARAEASSSVEGDGTPLGNQLADAHTALERAESDLADLRARTGPMVPQAEVAFIASFPAQVVRLSAHVGDPVQPPLVTIASSGLLVAVQLPPGQASLVTTGMAATISSETLGQQHTGVVTTVGTLQTRTPAGRPADSPFVPVTVEPSDGLDSDWIGLNVRIVITVPATDSAVLAVPLSAVSAAADGKASLLVVRPDGRRINVGVVAGVSAGGYVEVTPINAGLAAGDAVWVGQ